MNVGADKMYLKNFSYLILFLSSIISIYSDLSISFESTSLQIDAVPINGSLEGNTTDKITIITTQPNTYPVSVVVNFLNPSNFNSSDFLTLKVTSVTPSSSQQVSTVNLWNGTNAATNALLINDGNSGTVDYNVLFEYSCSNLNRSAGSLSGTIQIIATAS